MPKLSANLPKNNGLDAILDELLEDPTRRRVVVAVVDCPKIVEDTASGERDATVRVLRIEQIHPDDRADAERLVRRAVEHRTGTEGLPIDWLDPATDHDPVKIDTRTGTVLVPSDADADDGEWEAAAADGRISFDDDAEDAPHVALSLHDDGDDDDAA